jgi:hypothetical protein
MEQDKDKKSQQIDEDLTQRNEMLPVDQGISVEHDSLGGKMPSVPKTRNGATATLPEKEAIRSEKRRRNNAIQSARKRERQRNTMEKLKSQCSELYETNLALFRKNQVLDVLVQQALSLVGSAGQYQTSNEKLSFLPKTVGSRQLSSTPWVNQQLVENVGEYRFTSDNDTLHEPKGGPQEGSMISKYTIAPMDGTFGCSSPQASSDSQNVLGYLSNDATIPSFIDANSLYQNLLPTLLLIEAGVDPLPILQQKIAQHISSIYALKQQEELHNRSYTQVRSLLSDNSIAPQNVKEDVSTYDASHQSTQSKENALMQENSINNLAQNLIMQWLNRKANITVNAEQSTDKKPAANR